MATAAVESKPSRALHHLSLAVADLARAAAFYDVALAALGYRRVSSGPTSAGYGYETGKDHLLLNLVREGLAIPGAGFHFAFAAPSRAAVDAFHAQAIAHGGKDNGPPGLRLGYGPHYYAAFVTDPDGYRIEAVINAPD
jgi:catechol 2,3-dioxygenase-like lactoylglutathione lyase family enzyme